MQQLPAIQVCDQQLQSKSVEIQKLLPADIECDQFLAIAINSINSHAQSQKLLSADRGSLFNAIRKSATDGLLIDGRESTLVTFSGQVAYMPMVQGLVKLASNSGEVTKIYANVVYQNDKFRYRPGIETEPLFDPDWFGDRGAAIGAYAVVLTKSGEPIVSVMKSNRILAIGQGGKNGYQYDPKKGPHFEEWWKKTAIKNVLKYAPRSTRLDSALSHDNENIDPNSIPSSYVDPAVQQVNNINDQLAQASREEREVSGMTIDQKEQK